MSLDRFSYIYIFSDPFTKAVIYVGRTMHPESRFYAHLNTASKRKSNTPLYRAIRAYIEQGVKPLFSIIEECMDNPQEREQHWIVYYDAMGAPLLNVSKYKNSEGSYALKEYRERCRIQKEKMLTAPSIFWYLLTSEQWQSLSDKDQDKIIEAYKIIAPITKFNPMASEPQRVIINRPIEV